MVVGKIYDTLYWEFYLEMFEGTWVVISGQLDYGMHYILLTFQPYPCFRLEFDPMKACNILESYYGFIV